MPFSRTHACSFLLAIGAATSACAAPAGETDEPVEAADQAVTSGRITSARAEIGLVHVEGVQGLYGDLGWATGTVVLRRDVVITAARATGSRALPFDAAGHGTFTTTSGSRRTTHTVTEAALVSGTRLALLRIDPPVDASIAPAAIAPPNVLDASRNARATFYGYGYRNLVCLPMTGSDGQKSYVTRRYRDFGGLFTGPLGVGYTCEADLGGPIALGEVGAASALVAIDVDSGVDGYEEPGRSRAALDAIVASWR